MSKNLDCTNYCSQCEEAGKKVAELERKLAEQQALFIIMAHGTDRDELLRISGYEELNNLLAKAKEEEREACAGRMASSS